MRASTTNYRLLGLSGSIRRDSTNTAILRTLSERLGSRASLSLFPLDHVPLYNGDLEGELMPQPVRDLKEAIARSDGLVLCSPEYNHGMSGVLKNALDWASRPGFASPLKNKPALIMASSPAYTGGARAHAQMREALAAALARVIARPQVAIANVMQKVVNGQLVDNDTVKFCIDAIEDLLSEIHSLSNARAVAAAR
jgi:chromate reductase